MLFLAAPLAAMLTLSRSDATACFEICNLPDYVSDKRWQF
jgi:hypothetical protein